MKGRKDPFGGTTPFELRARNEWGLSDLDARALLIVVKNNWITCARLGDQLWGKPGRGNCSCPWARPAGVVVKRLRKRGLVEQDRQVKDLTAYRPTRAVERVLSEMRSK